MQPRTLYSPSHKGYIMLCWPEPVTPYLGILRTEPANPATSVTDLYGRSEDYTLPPHTGRDLQAMAESTERSRRTDGNPTSTSVTYVTPWRSVSVCVCGHMWFLWPFYFSRYWAVERFTCDFTHPHTHNHVTTRKHVAHQTLKQPHVKERECCVNMDIKRLHT